MPLEGSGGLANVLEVAHGQEIPLFVAGFVSAMGLEVKGLS
jgi:hypothetical protein